MLLERARNPVAVLPPPSVLLWSAEPPMAVFCMPIPLLRSASAPMAVFWKLFRFQQKRCNANGRIFLAVVVQHKNFQRQHRCCSCRRCP